MSNVTSLYFLSNCDIFVTFARVNPTTQIMNYINISAFLIGISTAFFTIFSMHILFWRRAFQKIMGCKPSDFPSD